MMFFMRLLPILILLTSALAQTPAVPGIPSPARWRNAAASSSVGDDGSLAIVGGKSTNWFVNPADGHTEANSPVLLFKAGDEFTLRAKLTVDFHTRWDAGCLVVFADETTWGKFCFEMTQWMEPTVISVVTRGRSDDNNSIPIAGGSVYLEIAKSGQGINFYASKDGRSWRLTRAFHLGERGPLELGFSSQSPVGEGCRTVFSAIRYTPKAPADFWKGE
jgi:regulation of enolase protein 1 (concanavalin A-like superfamily)